MKEKINRLIKLIILFAMLIGLMYLSNSNNLSISMIYQVLFSVCATTLLYYFYKITFSKIKNLSNKTEIVIIALYLIVITWSLFISSPSSINQVSSNNQFIQFLYLIIENIAKILSLSIDKTIQLMNIIIIDLSLLITYQLIRRLKGKQNAFYALILYTIALPFIVLTSNTNIYSLAMFITPLIVYNYASIDFEHLSRKKNLIRFILTSILLYIGFRINWLSVIVIIPYFIMISRNIRKTNTIKLILITVILSFVCYLGLEQIIFRLLSLDNNLSTQTFNINSYQQLKSIEYFVISIIVFLMYSFLIIYKRNISDKSDINSLTEFTLFLNLILSIITFNIFGITNLFIPIFVIYISINSNKKSIIKKVNFKKYRKVKRENAKKVSVVIPSYNYAHYIISRIDSVLKQTYPIYELIILDDCSSDNSVEVIKEKMKEIEEKYPYMKLKFIPNKKNSGNVFKQWTKSFEVATGDYLWIAEADDLSNKYFLSAVMDGFNNEKVVISYCESLAIDENNKVYKKDLRDWIDIYDTGRWNQKYFATGKNELEQALCINNTIANVSSVVFKNDKKINFSKYLKTSQEFTLSGDWYFYSMVLLHGSIVYFSESLNYHRMHSNSVTHTTDNFVHYKEIVRIQEEIAKHVKLSNIMKNRVEDRRNKLKRNLCIAEEEIKYDSISLEELTKKKNINDDILLSIIIPVYNTEPYLKKCLKSVFASLPERTEVIIINDGSPDNSEEIILEFKKKYPKQIVYIKQENSGLSSVKNKGLKLAQGKYLIYLDSDDSVSSNMYSTMLKKAIDEDADIVYCDVLMVYEDNSIRYCCCTNYERDDEILRILDLPLMAASWNKLVKRDLYSNLDFPKEFNNEDIAVTPSLFLRSKKTVKVESPFYKYLQRTGSIQNSGFNEKRFMAFDTTKICFERIKKYDYITREKVEGAVLTHQVLALLIYLVSKTSGDERKKYINMFCKRYNELEKINNNYYVMEYLENLKLGGLIKLIENDDIDKINRMLEKAKVD